MGNSADRAWQLSQLVEGVLTACNPSYGSLSYVQAGHCVSKQIGRHDAACQGCPRCVSRSPVLGTPQSRRALWGEEQRRSDCAFVLARKRKIRSLLRRGRRARRARFPTCGVIRVAGYSVVWDLSFPPPLFPLKSTKRSAAAIIRSQRSFITFSWCASEYSVVGRISCYALYDSIGTNVCQWLFAENFLSPISLLNRFHQQFRISTFDDNNRITATNILIVVAVLI